MYSAKLKVGNVIAVYGVRPSAGASTLAAMTASVLAARGEKTLLLSTDADIPYDAVSLLSDEIADNHMDELVVLENSNGLNAERMADYITFLTDNLGYIRASAKLTRLTKDAARTINNIVDMACYDFRYVVVDIGYASTPYANAILQKADLVMHALGQDSKSIASAVSFYKHGGFGEEKYTVPILTDYIPDIPGDAKSLGKALDVEEVFSIAHSASVFKACASRNIASFVYKGVRRKGGLFGGLGRKSKGEADEAAVGTLDEICDLIMKALEDSTSETFAALTNMRPGDATNAAQQEGWN